jgi:hypothetical protein
VRHVRYFLDGFVTAFLWWAFLFIMCFALAKAFLLVVGE